MKELLTGKDLTRLFNCSYHLIDQMLETGRLPKPLNIGTEKRPRYRWTETTIQNWLNRHGQHPEDGDSKEEVDQVRTIGFCLIALNGLFMFSVTDDTVSELPAETN